MISSEVCFSHGVSHNEIKGGLLVEARNSNSKPINGCNVKVYSPENSEEEFQSGYTDINGNFVFYPDCGGKWKVELDNGKGYKKTMVMQVSDSGVGIEVFYADDTPISYSDAVVYCPGSDKKFQQGLTDKNGKFMFSPDRKGDWEIKVDDGMGHGVVTKVSVGEGRSIIRKRAGVRFPVWQKIMIGVSLIWGFTGLYFYFKTRKSKLNKD